MWLAIDLHSASAHRNQGESQVQSTCAWVSACEPWMDRENTVVPPAFPVPHGPGEGGFIKLL